MRLTLAVIAAVLSAAVGLSAPAAVAAEEGWTPLFDGRSLASWKASESRASFRVVDGAIACDGPRAHLFCMGPDGKASFADFEVQAEVKTRAGANSGFYFHTAFQEKDWPAQVKENFPSAILLPLRIWARLTPLPF
jgi:hypothetical protein